MAGKQGRLPFYLSLGLVAVLIALYWIWPAYHDFIRNMVSVLASDDEGELRQWISQFGAWGPVVIILAMILQMFLIVLPSWGLMIVAVLAYGPVMGSILSIVAVLVASTAGYFIGYFLSESALESLIGRNKAKKVEAYAEKYGFWGVVVVRLAPFLSNDAISLIAGVIRMGYFRFLAATFVGITPLAAATGYLGRDIDTLKTALIWISIPTLIALAGKIAWDHFHGSRPDETESISD